MVLSCHVLPVIGNRLSSPFFPTTQQSLVTQVQVSKSNNNRLLAINRPFPNYLWPLFQSESWCSSFHMKISFYSHANENSFS